MSFGNLEFPENPCGGYRTPDSYTVGTRAYYEWLNCGLGGNSAEHGGEGRSGGGGGYIGGEYEYGGGGGGGGGYITRAPIQTPILNRTSGNANLVIAPNDTIISGVDNSHLIGGLAIIGLLIFLTRE